MAHFPGRLVFQVLPFIIFNMKLLSLIWNLNCFVDWYIPIDIIVGDLHNDQGQYLVIRSTKRLICLSRWSIVSEMKKNGKISLLQICLKYVFFLSECKNLLGFGIDTFIKLDRYSFQYLCNSFAIGFCRSFQHHSLQYGNRE